MNKKIKIISSGSIRALRGVSGPIYNPFITDTTTIINILFEGHKVIEVLSDGTEVELDILNYNKDLDREHLLAVDKEKQLEALKSKEHIQTQVTENGYITNKNSRRKNKKRKVDQLES